MRRRFAVAERTTAAAEGDVVVLLIGMRINHFWAVHHWLPVLASMPRTLRELGKRPESGLLNHILLTASPRAYCVVPYGESKEKPYAYAHAPGTVHHRARTFVDGKERQGRMRGHVGPWHEAYVVPQGSYEAIHADMPAFGLAAAHGQIALEKRGRRAKDRFAYRPERPARPEVAGKTAPSAVADGA
ncbi:DUF4188 domain-containing protein [Streptomyces sp. DSM 41972]|uniref:DUF4188 domain-containing protein n=1 Tax=Streptomyces althioticus subsp. attaecolombicae TaxID=3075534 RepID=A0ABU3HVG1_9ACTN|nr:DUF4188 domain-containing protein [Streptomyces sp. DSM 41972]SCD96172.1 protein of unknown function [Streptomyces sp. di50b]SCE33487.1 protein of unknown function [Streptomyces sp. di188]